VHREELLPGVADECARRLVDRHVATFLVGDEDRRGGIFARPLVGVHYRGIA
jgi:hypothetical protein